MSGDRGSALLLVPAGVLVVLVLASIVIDNAVVFLAEREAAAAASSAANDVASMALDEVALREGSGVSLDPELLDAVAPALTAVTRSQLSAAFVDGTVSVSFVMVDDTTVEVTVSGAARRVVGPFGWAERTREVSASARGTIAIS